MRFDYLLKQLFCKHDMIVKKEHMHINYANKPHFNGWLQTETCKKCGYIKMKKVSR